MDPASAIGLAAAVIDIFKDTFLVGKWVYKTINSGLNHEIESKEVADDFHYELLLLQSFGRWFQKRKGTFTHEADLDKVRRRTSYRSAFSASR